MSKSKVSLAVLTWKSPKTLHACLTSIAPIFDFFDERLIVCQESDPREIEIAEEFGMRIVATKTNLGIQGGLKKCFEEARNELVFFCENDLQLSVPVKRAVTTLSFAADYMMTNDAKCTYLRYLPQSAERRAKDFHKFWRVEGNIVKPRLKARLRPRTARFKLGKASPYIHQERLSCHGFETVSEDFLLTDSSCHPHENRALLAKRSYISTLIDFAEANSTSRQVNGSPDLEHPLNCRQNRDWFINQKFQTLIAVPGVFGHRRYDRDAQDDKWHMVNPVDDGGEVVVS